MRIEVKTVDPSAMRYPTAGDWEWLPDGALMLTVPEYGGNDVSVLLVAIHEMIEAYLCKRDGVTDEMVTKWDTDNPLLEEPGDDLAAPYHKQHVIAMAIEKECATATRTDWKAHDNWVFNVGNEVERIEKRGELRKSRILLEGARHWAELHLFALRHEGKPRAIHQWFLEWAGDLPFGDCPCKAHFNEWVRDNPPDFFNFFPWTIRLHNVVNERIGKPQIEVDAARKLWQTRSF